jgi:hypothetical protein
VPAGLSAVGCKLERAALHAAAGLEQLRDVHGNRSVPVHPQLLLEARSASRQDDVEAVGDGVQPYPRVVVSGADSVGKERFEYRPTSRRNAGG